MDLVAGDKVIVVNKFSYFFGWFAKVDRVAEEQHEDGDILVEFMYQEDWPPPEHQGKKCIVRFERIDLGRLS